MLVLDVMSAEVVTISGDTSPDAAVRLMDQNKIRHLPVAEGGVIVGVVSDRDLLAATGWLPSEQSDRPSAVSKVMHTPVKTLHPEDQLVTATLQLILHGIGCMPVVDDGRIVGIVTDMDLLRGFEQASLDGQLTGEHDPPIARLMTRKTVCVERQTTLQKAARMMHSIRTHHLPVVDSERLVGMISDRDLRWAEGRKLADDTPVEDFMSDFVITVDPAHPVTAAAGLMVEHRFSALPVVEDNRLVGILTSTDLLEHCMQTLWEPESAPRH